MPNAIKTHVRYVDAVSRRVGRVAMHLVFAMAAILLWLSISTTFFLPSLGTIEMVQYRDLD